MARKIEEYEEAKGIAQYVASHAAGTLLLPFKIVIFTSKITAKGLRHALGVFLMSRDINNIGTTLDPDGDGVWLRKR